MTSEPSKDDERSFEERENERIHERRSRAFPGSTFDSPTDPPENVVGLSLSGGGLRSAMFNDGFLQGLSHSGLLRYVDYLCSVSGGGYIAAHLATRADRDSKTNFHDDVHSDGVTQRWSLGRDPDNGTVDPNRLVGVGRYLASKVALAPSFLWSFLLSMLVFIGITGVVATLLALFWRSFDNPMFRVLLRNFLDIRFGDELTIAFYPAFIVLFVWLTLCAWGWFRNSPSQRKTNRLGLILFLGAILVSIAVFIGNGKTSVTADGAAMVELNHYAQWLAISAAVLQVIAFVGRDLLFKSERDESKNWQKALQKLATSGVIIFAFFAMVHWMARENISNYTAHRNPHLVRGDVTDWDTLQRVSLGYENWQRIPPGPSPAAIEPRPNLSIAIDVSDANVNAFDDWQQRQLTHPFLPLTHELLSQPSDPPADDQELTTEWTFWQRFGGAMQAWVYSQLPRSWLVNESRAVENPRSVGDFYRLTHHRWHQQREFLSDFNPVLEQEKFTQYLWSLAAKYPLKVDDDHPISLAKLKLDSLKEQLSLRSGDQPNEVYRRTKAQANRDLLAAIFPGTIQDPKIASTLVVPPYDQATRWRLLIGWWTVLCIGICLSAIRNQTSTLYIYYRNRIARLFLDSEMDRPYSSRNPPQYLHELRPTEDGLPHPLFLAARMKPRIIAGSYNIENRPFIFSPIYCGDIQGECFKTEDIGLPGVFQSPLTIGDAVTMSGAAVTPFMTDNRALSIVLSFFGDGLGQWLIRRKSGDNSVKKSYIRQDPTLAAIVFIGLIALAFLGWYAFGFAFTLLLVVLLSLAACIIGRRHSGICQFIVAIAVPPTMKSEKTLQPVTTTTTSTTETPRSQSSDLLGHVADGGFYDYLGVSELFRRECSLIIVSDAGAHLGNNPLGPLAKMCTEATARYGVQILDLDHESPIDFGRLEIDKNVTNERVVHQPYLVARLRYRNGKEGTLIYCQMAITDSDPIEIQQIRHRFPSFPDEPTTNQFYTNEQVAAYRNLGHHIASRMSSELFRWTSEDIKEDVDSTKTQPLYDVVRNRLMIAYRLACYQEQTYKADDLFSEAIWSSTRTSTCRSFDRTLDSCLFVQPPVETLTESWLRAYERNADVRAKYRHAVLADINSTEDRIDSACAKIWQKIVDRRMSYAQRLGSEPEINDRDLMSAHLAAMAVACHEIHAGRPHAIFQVGGREKLVSMCQKLRDVLVDLPATEDELPLVTSVHTPLDETSLNLAAKQCIGEIVELEKCTFQGSERVTTVSFSQCMVMMWGQLSQQSAPINQTSGSFDEIADRIRKEGVELAASKVRIWLERGLRKKILSDVVKGLENAWCITYLPDAMIKGSHKKRNRRKSASAKKTR